MLPTTGSKEEMKTIVVTAALIKEQKKILITQRREDAHCRLLWEFPGGKVQEGEEPRQALHRELEEELGIEAEVGGIFESVFHVYPEYPVLLLVYHCRVIKGVPGPLACHDLRWVDLEELAGFPMPPADDPIRRKLGSSPRQQKATPAFAGMDECVPTVSREMSPHSGVK
jgi:8-oxo-dGTP diphosphatase